MTEEEAKTKVCCGPKVLAAAIFIAGKAKTTEPLGPVLCAGSACMAWRSEPGADRRRLEAQNPRMPMGEIAKIESGWCGLAGKP